MRCIDFDASCNALNHRRCAAQSIESSDAAIGVTRSVACKEVLSRNQEKILRAH
jgi:hypothetical protein